MNAIKHIRKEVFGLRQQEFAALAGVPQSRVSRWESGQSEPSRDEMARIRAAAKVRKLKRKWSDELFFTVPGQAA